MKNPFTGFIKIADYSRHSTQFEFRPSDARDFTRLSESIPDNDIFFGTEDEPHGRETKPHITVLYGLKKFVPGKIAELVGHWRPVRIRLGKISRFGNNEKGYDVLKVEVHGTHLHRLHQKLRESTDNDFSFDTYNPHVTIAYVRPGAQKELDGDTRFEGREYTFDKLVCKNKNGRDVKIQLAGMRINPFVKKSGFEKRSVIRKRDGKYVLLTKDEEEVLGRHDTYAEAAAQETAIQKSKERRNKKNACVLKNPFLFG